MEISSLFAESGGKSSDYGQEQAFAKFSPADNYGNTEAS